MDVAHVRANPSRTLAMHRPLRRSASAAAPSVSVEPGLGDTDKSEGNWWEKLSPLPAEEEGAQTDLAAGATSAAKAAPLKRKKRVVQKVSRSMPSMEIPEPQRVTVFLPPSDDPPEQQLAVLRMQMIGRMGSAREAFQTMDTNGSGTVSFNEFERTFPRILGLTEGMPGFYRSIRRLWRLFDIDHKGFLDFKKVFPDEHWTQPEAPERMNTPEFLDYWTRKTREFPTGHRSAAWTPPTGDKKLEHAFSVQDIQAENREKKERMRAMIKRLKVKGKSSARIRDIVATHLPRGTGPLDMQEVPTFSPVEVQQIKSTYYMEVDEPSRNIQREVFSLRDSRRSLYSSRYHLGTVMKEDKRFVLSRSKDGTPSPLVSLGDAFRTKTEDQNSSSASDKAGASAMQLAPAERLEVAQGSAADDPAGSEASAPEVTVEDLAERYYLDASDVAVLLESFMAVARDGAVDVVAFVEMTETLCPGDTTAGSLLKDADREACFAEASQETSELAGCRLASGTPSLGSPPAQKGSVSGKRGALIPPPAPFKCNFEQFLAWYENSRLRVLLEK